MARPKGKTLSLSDVLLAAQAVLERDGADCLTLSNVAHQLGIRPPSVCHHIPSNEELRIQVAEQSWLALAKHLEMRSKKRDPREQISGLSRAIRRFALGHPNAFQHMIHTHIPSSRTSQGPIASGLLAPFYSALLELGVPKDRVIHATRALRSAVTGFLLLETSGQFELKAALAESFECLISALLDGLTPPALPPTV